MADYMAVLTARPSEVVNVKGIKIEVRGLSLGEARKIGEDKNAGIKAIVASCYVDGKPAFTEEDVDTLNPVDVQELDAAIGRVNSHKPGN